mmetsp:Transcript_29330/g.64934  ORF Transcript_29330/g.64934 Transcript_29330/m.64934 type:complete len:150 (-) Transcript_29330:140-589(-)
MHTHITNPKTGQKLDSGPATTQPEHHAHTLSTSIDSPRPEGPARPPRSLEIAHTPDTETHTDTIDAQTPTPAPLDDTLSSEGGRSAHEVTQAAQTHSRDWRGATLPHLSAHADKDTRHAHSWSTARSLQEHPVPVSTQARPSSRKQATH